MIDLRKTIEPKSDQLNADDLRGTTKTITVTNVSLLKEADQPIAVNYEGDNGKPYKPCKSMRRVMVNVWGGDGATYAGKSMTLFCDDKVSFGGVATGGIRISHMSHIDKDITMALTASRTSRKPYVVKPLVIKNESIDIEELKALAKSAANFGTETLKKYWERLNKAEKSALEPIKESLKVTAQAVDAKNATLENEGE